MASCPKAKKDNEEIMINTVAIQYSNGDIELHRGADDTIGITITCEPHGVNPPTVVLKLVLTPAEWERAVRQLDKFQHPEDN